MPVSLPIWRRQLTADCELRRSQPCALASLLGITVLDLDLTAALSLARQETWAAAHSQYAAQPTPDRPDGAIIATTAPHRWAGEPVRVLDLTT
ncbi:hypothetical protein SO3561_08008 [Streptomyces olivochromogenes]|uniref:Uncharacterized protein n=1 Tax=Streptomyces olivochromogenes TaxID=1963 RepID=A0A250VQK9_STROL|nr:hypothetical protein SO3561_08008 [Streptomyces olivochromogenes]